MEGKAVKNIPDSVPDEMGLLRDMIEDVTPRIHEFRRRASKLTDRFFFYRSSPYVRQEAIRVFGDIFKYGMCLGFDSLYNNIPFEDDAEPGNNAKPNSGGFGKLISDFHKNDIHLIRAVNMIGISDTLECGITTGMLMWRILITLTEIAVMREWDDEENDRRPSEDRF